MPVLAGRVRVWGGGVGVDIVRDGDWGGDGGWKGREGGLVGFICWGIGRMVFDSVIFGCLFVDGGKLAKGLDGASLFLGLFLLESIGFTKAI